MNILHSGSLDVKSGGPAFSTYLSIRGLIENDVPTEIIMPPLDGAGKLIAEDISIHYTSSVQNARLGYMPNLKQQLRQMPLYDLYHVQGLWQYLGNRVASYARNVNKPYLITLRGMLYPQALAHSSWIKKISLILYQRRDLQQAACIQVTCLEEMQYYRELGFTNPVAVIPNPIDIIGHIDLPISIKDKIRIGYLGRLHPRKRIERLIYAFDTLREKFRDIELVIIGSDDKLYEEFLHEEVKRLKLPNVRFTGFLTGEKKDKAINDLYCLVVPSDFENFGNIVTEALVRGVPVVASTGMPWQELEKYNCGWWINNDQESINETLVKVLDLTVEERNQMGINGKLLMKEKYSVEVIGCQMRQLYEWILNKKEKPHFVYE